MWGVKVITLGKCLMKDGCLSVKSVAWRSVCGALQTNREQKGPAGMFGVLWLVLSTSQVWRGLNLTGTGNGQGQGCTAGLEGGGKGNWNWQRSWNVPCYPLTCCDVIPILCVIYCVKVVYRMFWSV